MELLQLSDQFMLDHLKQICEVKLKAVVEENNVDAILEHGEMFNAEQIVRYCRHYKRNYCSGGGSVLMEGGSAVGGEVGGDKGVLVMGLGGGGSSVDSAVFAEEDGGTPTTGWIGPPSRASGRK